MKILQVINHLDKGGGAEQCAHDISLSFLKEGHEVGVLDIYRSPNNQLIDSVTAAGASCSTLGEKRISLSSFIKLGKLLKKGEYDVVHVHLFPALYYCGFAKMLFHVKTPIVYTEHSTKNRRRGNVLFRLLDSVVYRQYNSIVCITEKVKESLCDHVHSIKPLVINNGVNVEKIVNTPPHKVRELLKISEDTVLVVMIGRFVEGKDYETVFKAMQGLDKKYHFVCIGEGPRMNDCISSVKKRGLEDRVHFMGLRTDVVELVKGCDIAVLSTEHEGFSISMLEVMACRKPFIASSVPGIYDLVADNSLLFPYRDSLELSRLIEKCAENKMVYEEYSRRSFDFASRYDINRTAAEYYSVYKSLLSQK